MEYYQKKYKDIINIIKTFMASQKEDSMPSVWDDIRKDRQEWNVPAKISTILLVAEKSGLNIQKPEIFYDEEEGVLILSSSKEFAGANSGTCSSGLTETTSLLFFRKNRKWYATVLFEYEIQDFGCDCEDGSYWDNSRGSTIILAGYKVQ